MSGWCLIIPPHIGIRVEPARLRVRVYCTAIAAILLAFLGSANFAPCRFGRFFDYVAGPRLCSRLLNVRGHNVRGLYRAVNCEFHATSRRFFNYAPDRNNLYMRVYRLLHGYSRKVVELRRQPI